MSSIPSQLHQPLIQFAESDEFIRGYIDCLLWSEIIETEDRDSEYYAQSFSDSGFTIDDINPDSLMEIINDCGAFERMALVPLHHAYESGYTRGQAGHDFALTRNGHGTGFWDRGLPVLKYVDCGELLTDHSKIFGTMGLQLGDDDKVYTHG